MLHTSTWKLRAAHCVNSPVWQWWKGARIRGWTLKKEKKQVWFKQRLRNYLNDVLKTWVEIGKKANPAEVALTIRTHVDKGERIFAAEDCWKPSQIISYFSSLSIHGFLEKGEQRNSRWRGWWIPWTRSHTGDTSERWNQLVTWESPRSNSWGRELDFRVTREKQRWKEIWVAFRDDSEWSWVILRSWPYSWFKGQAWEVDYLNKK